MDRNRQRLADGKGVGKKPVLRLLKKRFNQFLGKEEKMRLNQKNFPH